MAASQPPYLLSTTRQPLQTINILNICQWSRLSETFTILLGYWLHVSPHQHHTMDRREFLEKAGAGAALALAVACLGSCTSPVSPVSQDFTLDLTNPSYSKLASTKGSYVIYSDCVIVYGTDGKYYAVTVICSHQQQKQVYYNSSGNRFICNAHGAEYSLTGTGLNPNGSKGLTTYNCVLSGTSLHVYS